ncbi:hypothetical protein U1Q18_020661 [Sarracenia purpurea var. burkii]
METQDPSPLSSPQPIYHLPHNDYICNNNLNPFSSGNPSPTTPTAPQIPLLFTDSASAAAAPSSVFKGLYHRRAYSDSIFQIVADDVSGELFSGFCTPSLEETGSDDDLVSVFLDLQELGENGNHGGADCFMDHDHTGGGDGSCSVGVGGAGGDGDDGESKKGFRLRHGCINLKEGLGEVDEVKATPPEKVAEICALDPKRVKRILANRQSAARSKERRARYVLELERQVQSLRSEAMNLSAQLTIYQRDTKGLTAENAELRFRLQAMDQQAQLRDALNEALRQEVERLKIVTGEIRTPTTEPCSLGVRRVPHSPLASPSTLQQPIQYSPMTSPSTLQTVSYSQAASPSPRTATSPFPLLKRSVPVLSQLPPLHNSRSSLSRRLFNRENPGTPPEQDSFSSLQGMEIGNQGSNLLSTESLPVSGGESSRAAS